MVVFFAVTFIIITKYQHILALDMATLVKEGDLVLCLYSDYPYWPAIVTRVDEGPHEGQFMTSARLDNGERVSLCWVEFQGDDTGAWVRHDHILLYHPFLIPKIRATKGQPFASEQHLAIQKASLLYRDQRRRTWNVERSHLAEYLQWCSCFVDSVSDNAQFEGFHDLMTPVDIEDAN